MRALGPFRVGASLGLRLGFELGLWQTDTCNNAETATRCETITFSDGDEVI